MRWRWYPPLFCSAWRRIVSRAGAVGPDRGGQAQLPHVEDDLLEPQTIVVGCVDGLVVRQFPAAGEACAVWVGSGGVRGWHVGVLLLRPHGLTAGRSAVCCPRVGGHAVAFRSLDWTRPVISVLGGLNECVRRKVFRLRVAPRSTGARDGRSSSSDRAPGRHAGRRCRWRCCCRARSGRLRAGRHRRPEVTGRPVPKAPPGRHTTAADPLPGDVCPAHALAQDVSDAPQGSGGHSAATGLDTADAAAGEEGPTGQRGPTDHQAQDHPTFGELCRQQAQLPSCTSQPILK